MGEGLIAAGAAVVVAVVGAITQVFARRRDLRAEIVADLDIADRLDPESSAAKSLVSHAERRIEDLIASDQAHSRDVVGLQASVTLAILAALSLYVALLGGWWRVAWVPFGALTLFAVFGFAISIKRKDRTEELAAREARRRR